LANAWTWARRAAIAAMVVVATIVIAGAVFWKPLLIQWHLRGIRECQELNRQYDEALEATLRKPHEFATTLYVGAAVGPPSVILSTTHRLVGFPHESYFVDSTVLRIVYHCSELERLGVSGHRVQAKR
jgi:hypothetical protein